MIFGQPKQTADFGSITETKDTSACLVKFTMKARLSILLGSAPPDVPHGADQAYLQVCTEGEWQQLCQCVVDDPKDPDDYPKTWVESPGNPCCSRVEGTLSPGVDPSETGVIVIRHVNCYKWCTPKDGDCSSDDRCLGRAGGALEDRAGETKCCGDIIRITPFVVDALGSNCNCPQNDLVEKLRCINENCFGGNWTTTLTALITMLEGLASDMGGINNFWRNSCACFNEMKSVTEAKNPCSKLSCGIPAKERRETEFI